MLTDGAVLIPIELSPYECRALARVAGLWETVLREAVPAFGVLDAAIVSLGGAPPLATAQGKLEVALMEAGEAVV